MTESRKECSLRISLPRRQMIPALVGSFQGSEAEMLLI